MDLASRKLHFIEQVLAIRDAEIIDELESALQASQQEFDSVLKERLTLRALKANQDIQEGRLYSRNEAEARLKERMGG